MKKDIIESQSGELSVSGADFVNIPLFRRDKPLEVSVFFDDDCDIIPCNPADDKLDYLIHHKQGKVFLKIEWNVSSLRNIAWEVRY